jgi:hypothetical protein
MEWNYRPLESLIRCSFSENTKEMEMQAEE